MRVRRLLLFALVALNLTLVCQGHEADGSHTGLHFALFGEPHLEPQVGRPPAEAAGQQHQPGSDPAEDHGQVESASRLPLEEGGRESDPALLSAGHSSSIVMLAVALLGTAGGTARTLSLHIARGVAWASRCKQPPESPPPQTIL